jgi:membrane protein
MTVRPGDRRAAFAARVESLSTRWEQSLPGHTWARGRQLDVATHTLALAAQQVLCTAPLLVAMSALLRRFHLGSVVVLLANLLDLDTASTTALDSLFRSSFHPSLGVLVVGLLLSVAFAVSAATTTQRMLETVWGVARAPWTSVWRQVVWVLALTPAMALAMYAARLSRAAPASSGAISVALVAVTEGLCAAAFAWWTQRLLLGGRVTWRRLLPAAGLIGLGLGIASVVSALIVPDQIIDEVHDYGPIGASFVLSVWVVALTGIMVVGSLAGAVIAERRLGHEPVHTRPPDPRAAAATVKSTRPGTSATGSGGLSR